MKKTLLRIVFVVGTIYLIICMLLFFFQERVIFLPVKLDRTYQFSFDQRFEEKYIRMKDHDLLNCLLFRADSSRGVIFYLHGNAGSLDSWGSVAKTYTALNYDVFMLDYRGYGKSDGKIDAQNQMFEDIQTVYDSLKRMYPENKIIVLGYSLGTGPATHLASENHPELLILQAPYYSMTDMMRHRFPIIPTFLLKYKFETDRYIRKCTMPVVIFHGTADQVIYYGSSLKLKEEFKKQDTLITLVGQGHNGISDNPEYKIALEKVLFNSTRSQ